MPSLIAVPPPRRAHWKISAATADSMEPHQIVSIQLCARADASTFEPSSRLCQADIRMVEIHLSHLPPCRTGPPAPQYAGADYRCGAGRARNGDDPVSHHLPRRRHLRLRARWQLLQDRYPFSRRKWSLIRNGTSLHACKADMKNACVLVDLVLHWKYEPRPKLKVRLS